MRKIVVFGYFNLEERDWFDLFFIYLLFKNVLL